MQQLEPLHTLLPATEETTTLAYAPPYLSFMIKAVAALQLSDERRLPKDEIKRWLKDNWPCDLGELSDTKLFYMATFLRHPDDEKGGHFKGDR